MRPGPKPLFLGGFAAGLKSRPIKDGHGACRWPAKLTYLQRLWLQAFRGAEGADYFGYILVAGVDGVVHGLDVFGGNFAG